jgi:preprotein translocase subunit Sec61beta
MPVIATSGIKFRIALARTVMRTTFVILENHGPTTIVAATERKKREGIGMSPTGIVTIVIIVIVIVIVIVVMNGARRLGAATASVTTASVATTTTTAGTRASVRLETAMGQGDMIAAIACAIITTTLMTVSTIGISGTTPTGHTAMKKMSMMTDVAAVRIADTITMKCGRSARHVAWSPTAR